MKYIADEQCSGGNPERRALSMKIIHFLDAVAAASVAQKKR
jgi:hypothetical protein